MRKLNAMTEASKERQRRYQAALRRVLARFREAEPDRYRQWLNEALANYDGKQEKLT